MCATTGIMNTLSPAELEGVMAHELAHIKNRDVLIMTMASFFASVASMIMQFAFFFGSGDDDSPAGIIVFIASALVYAISFFLLLALSRYREFSADRGAALVTGRPSALASALMTISGTMERVPPHDLREAERMNAFFIVPAKRQELRQGACSPRTRRWSSASPSCSSSRRSSRAPPPSAWAFSTPSSGAPRSSRAPRPTACSP